MDYRSLGRTGMKVSILCLGCMNFGGKTNAEDSYAIIDRALVKPVMRSRRHRPLFLVDIAVPRDVDGDVTRLDDVFLYNVDDLQSIVNDNLKSRRGEADKADALVDQEVGAFASWLRSRSIGPLIGQLQAHGRELAEAEVARVLPKLGELDEQQRKLVEQLGQQIVKKLLHRPTTNLRRASAEGEGALDGVALAEALQVLFELGAEPGEGVPEQPADQPTPRGVGQLGARASAAVGQQPGGL